jgi:alpha-ribazole phosphatase
MVSNLFLLRHGETEGSGEKRYKGTIDVPLSESGIRQMERASEFIRAALDGPLGGVYSSDLIRARKSAEVIAAQHGAEPVAVDGLRERNFGLWEGLTFDEIRARHPREFAAWAKDPLRFSPMGGESTMEVRDRVVKVMDGILAAHTGGDIVAVAHGGVNRVLLCHFMGMPLENLFRVEQDFACVNIISFHDGYPVVRLINGGIL